MTTLPPKITLYQVYRVDGLCFSRKTENLNASPSISLTFERTNYRNIHYSNTPPSELYSRKRTKVARILVIFSGFSLTFLWRALPRALKVITHQGYLSKSSFKWLLFNRGFFEIPWGVNNWSLGIKSPAKVGKSYMLNLCFFKKAESSAGVAD